MGKTKQDILNSYQQLAARQQADIDVLDRKLRSISLSRLALFIVEIALVVMMINMGLKWFLLLPALIPVILFLVQVKKQSQVSNELAYARKLLWIYQNEISQVTTGQNGYSSGAAFESDTHPYASDLDIYGPGSLFAMLNRGNTRKGQQLLAAALGRPEPAAVIQKRQEGIAELREHLEKTFHFRAQLQDHDPAQMEQVREKLQNQLPLQLKFTRKNWLKPCLKLVPVLISAIFVAGMIYGGIIWNIFGIVALFSAALTFSQLKYINRLYYGFSGSYNQINAFASTIRWTEQTAWKSSYILGLFSSSQVSVSTEIRQLARIIQAFDARLNILLGMVLNLFLLWDLRCSLRLADWYQRSSGELLKGLDRVGQFEELIAYATLHYNEPDWTFPRINDEFSFSAKHLGHPLIGEQERIVNDFEFAAKPTVDIVTGSNMAGKSTFLRTIGINMVLAYAGAPVCASSLSLSVFHVLSYMRIRDSLNDHTSTFKAELNRLKMILDQTAGPESSFVLIDEMLRGTNSRDKYLGSKVFIEKLLDQGTPALFATHDLQLSEMEAQYPRQVRNYHFDIRINETEMQFDYQLRQGPCKTFNAALLLRQIGLTLN